MRMSVISIKHGRALANDRGRLVYIREFDLQNLE